jgi:hypothetical protein
VRQHRFRALITLGSAGEDAAQNHLDGTHTRCLVQPCDHKYFPAVISPDDERLTPPVVHAAVSAALDDSEADTFFAPGHCFTIWADAVVGHTIQADGLVGHGVIISFPQQKAADLLPSRRAHNRQSGRFRQLNFDSKCQVNIRRSGVILGEITAPAWAAPCDVA